MSSSKTGIEWTDKTWNPVTGCTKVSPGCDHCYAEAITRRFPDNFTHGFQVTLHPDRLSEPYRWRKPSRIFVNSMGDLFHKDVPLYFIEDVLEVIAENRPHTFQVLTKRHHRLSLLVPELNWPPNLWVGVSVENQAMARARIPALLKVPAPVRFLSCEPLLGPLDLSPWLPQLQWVIVGGESGAGFRPLDPAWVRTIRNQCKSHSVPFFFKQWGGLTPKRRGNSLDSQQYLEFPA